MRSFRLSPAAYLALSFAACVLPLVVLFTPERDWSWQTDGLHATIGLVFAFVLTFPAGVVGLVAYFLFLPGLAIGTPTESLALRSGSNGTSALYMGKLLPVWTIFRACYDGPA